jgi:hypothetical protein
MKIAIFILVLVFMVGTTNAVQPARKPFIKIKIDGSNVKTGDVITVNHGQKLKIEVELEGGRRDFCKFPDAYADIAGTAQILSRGDNGLTYELDGKKAEWKLLSETVKFSGEEYIQINNSQNQASAELTVANSKFSQTAVKAEMKASWQFVQDGIAMNEENVADAVVYLKIAGSSDVWFQSKNIKASGVKDNSIQEKLSTVQSACDSIEHNMYHLNFPVVQQNIRNLQASVNELKTTIDAVKSGNPTYKLNISFIGLPSDKPVSDIAAFASLKNAWASAEPFLTEQKQAVEKLTTESTGDNNKELSRLVTNYEDWQSKLPENSFGLLNKYIPEIHTDSIAIPEKIALFSKNKNDGDYEKTLKDFSSFLDTRLQKVPGEVQKIASTGSRIQAFRLFDGMLRSYFNSITWAEWVNNRE